MGVPAMVTLNNMAELAAEAPRVSEQGWMQLALRKLSVALVRGNSWRFKAGLSVGSRAAGRVYQAGHVQPALGECERVLVISERPHYLAIRPDPSVSYECQVLSGW